MALDKYDTVVDNVTSILSTCESMGVVDLETLSSSVEDISALQSEAFSGKVNGTHASKLAIKEAHDYVSAMKRFCDVYKYTRKDYYDKSKDYYTTHSGMLTHQKAVFSQLYEMAASK